MGLKHSRWIRCFAARLSPSRGLIEVSSESVIRRTGGNVSPQIQRNPRENSVKRHGNECDRAHLTVINLSQSSVTTPVNKTISIRHAGKQVWNL